MMMSITALGISVINDSLQPAQGVDSTQVKAADRVFG